MPSRRIPLKNTYYLIRHGEALSNQNNILISSIKRSPESPLTEDGQSQVTAMCSRLQGESITQIISSDFLRTQQTAEMVSDCLSIPVTYDARLRERFLGDFDGCHIDDMKAEVAIDDLQWDQCSHGMETYSSILERMLELVTELESRFQGESIALVSHSAPLRILRGWLYGIRGVELSPRSITMNQVAELANAEVLKVTERVEKLLG